MRGAGVRAAQFQKGIGAERTGIRASAAVRDRDGGEVTDLVGSLYGHGYVASRDAIGYYELDHVPTGHALRNPIRRIDAGAAGAAGGRNYGRLLQADPYLR